MISQYHERRARGTCTIELYLTSPRDRLNVGAPIGRTSYGALMDPAADDVAERKAFLRLQLRTHLTTMHLICTQRHNARTHVCILAEYLLCGVVYGAPGRES